MPTWVHKNIWNRCHIAKNAGFLPCKGAAMAQHFITNAAAALTDIAVCPPATINPVLSQSLVEDI